MKFLSNGINLTKYQNYFFILPAFLSSCALIAILLWGLKPGIDLSGGSLLEVTYPQGRPAIESVRGAIEPLGYGEVRIQPSGENSFMIRQRDLLPEEKTKIEAALSTLGEMKESQFNSVGPTIGAELLRKAWVAIVLVVLSIIIFIAFAFRSVSKPIKAWKYGVVVVVTLLHDILIPMGLFAYLGHTYGVEVDALFIVALLTILGISVNDTIVVFDRIRENLHRNDEANRTELFSDLVGRSLTQTLARSINTSVTVIIMLVALFWVGPVATRYFALTLIVGMVVGTYSSILLASPLVVLWERWDRKRNINA